MKYWHKVTDKEFKKLLDKKVTWGYVIKNYKQPDWCNYPEALGGVMGCWSLACGDIRKKVLKEYCKNCDCFIKNHP